MRNAWRRDHRTGQALRRALRRTPKLLLTATPLQNDLMELLGLAAFLDETLLGDEDSFRLRYATGELTEERAADLQARLAPGGVPDAAPAGEGVRPLHGASLHGGGLRALGRGAGPLRPGQRLPASRGRVRHPAGAAGAAGPRLPEDPGLLLLRAGEHARPAGRVAGAGDRRARRRPGGTARSWPDSPRRPRSGRRRRPPGRAGARRSGVSWRPSSSSCATAPAPRAPSASTPRARRSPAGWTGPSPWRGPAAGRRRRWSSPSSGAPRTTCASSSRGAAGRSPASPATQARPTGDRRWSRSSATGPRFSS